MKEALQRFLMHPLYHNACLGFWQAADRFGLNQLRAMSPDEITSVIYSIFDFPKDRKFRKLLTEAAKLWLLEEHHNFWGSFWDGEELKCQSLHSPDFTKLEVLKLLRQAEHERFESNFPADGILYLRSPLPCGVFLEHEPRDRAPFTIADTKSALGFDQTIMFEPRWFMPFVARLPGNRLTTCAGFGFVTILASHHEKEWHELMPSLIAQGEIHAFVEGGGKLTARITQ